MLLSSFYSLIFLLIYVTESNFSILKLLHFCELFLIGKNIQN